MCLDAYFIPHGISLKTLPFKFNIYHKDLLLLIIPCILLPIQFLNYFMSYRYFQPKLTLEVILKFLVVQSCIS